MDCSSIGGPYSLTSHQVPSFIEHCSLGKVDKNCLSQQTLMELFIEGIENKERIRKDGDDISEWWGVTSNDQGEVVGISWYFNDLEGTPDWKFLPATLTKIELGLNKLEGQVDLTQLPQSLKIFNIRNNQFSGSLDLTQLPPNLKFLDISNNQFTGKVDLGQLPSKINALLFDNNQFTERAGFEKLPNGIHYSEDGNNFE